MLFTHFKHCLRFCCFLIVLAVCCFAAAAETVKITILATADLHGEILQIEKAVVPAAQKEFRKNPQGTVFVDVGDTLQGTWRADRTQGRGILNKLAEGGCSVWVPGNHDLEFGFDVFKEQVRTFRGTVLGANLKVPELADEIKGFTIKEIHGVKVAFIGMVVGHMHMYYPVAEKHFQTLPAAAALRRSVDQAKTAGAEIFVLLRHAGKYGGGADTNKLLRILPEIDLVIGAHTHLPEPGCRIGNAWYVQPPPRGGKMVKATAFFDLEKRRVSRIDSELIVLEKIPVPEDPEQQEAAPAFDEKNMHSPAVKLRRILNTDLAVYSVPAAGFRLLLQKSNPKKKHYYDVFKYVDPMLTVKVTGAEFEHILKEYLAKAHKRKHFVAGSGFVCQASKGVLQDLQFEKKQDEYTLAISAFDVAGAGGQLPKTRKILIDRVDRKQAESAKSILDLLFQ